MATPSLELLPPHILDGICNFLTNDEVYSAAALARTSRVLNRHAIPAVWDTLPSIALILYAMPCDLWTTSISGGGENTFSLARPLCEDDLARVFHYTPHVKAILHHTHPACQRLPPRVRAAQVDASIYDAFAQSALAQPLFPNLRHLQLLYHRHKVVPFGGVLCGPSLRKATLEIVHTKPESQRDAQTEGYIKMLSHIRDASPFLEELSVGALRWYPHMFDAVSATLCGLHHLRIYHGHHLPISLDAFRHLARLPALRSLYAHVDVDDASEGQRAALVLDAPPSDRFPSLRALVLSAEHAASCVFVLRAVRSASLTSLMVHVNQPAVPAEVGELFSVLGAHPSRERLHTLRLTGAGEEAIADALLQPLLHLSSLEELSLNFDSPVLVTDTTLARMGFAWKAMRMLELGTTVTLRADPPLATVSGLAMLALGNPDLMVLGVPVDTREHAWPSGLRRAVSVGQSRLGSLNVGDSPLAAKDVAQTAAALSGVFPSLVSIGQYWLAQSSRTTPIPSFDRQTAWRSRWREVESLTPQFVRVRRQERNWAREHGRETETREQPMTLEEALDMLGGGREADA